ncbi:MAG: conjugal transfer protein TrbL family protein [Bacillota bacterium]
MFQALQDGAIQIATTVLTWLASSMLVPLNWLLSVFSSAGALRDLTYQPWAQNLIAGTQGIAMALLAVRVAWEALQMATLRAEGAPADPGSLLKRTVMAAAAIFGGPWLARQMIFVGNSLAAAMAQAGLGAGLEKLDLGSLFAYTTSPETFIWMLLLTIPAMVLLILVFFQGLVRTIEITLAAIISPLAALGYISGGGMADVWWREVAVISTSQAVQMLLLYMGAALLAAPAPWSDIQADLGPFLFVATLWVALRTPRILRNYAYSTGVGGIAGGVGQSASYVALSRIMTKMPF